MNNGILTYLDLVQNKEFRSFVRMVMFQNTQYSYYIDEEFPPLFRYRSITDYAVEDILNETITLSSIGEFNDVFDGAVHLTKLKHELQERANKRLEILEQLENQGIIAKNLISNAELVAPYYEEYERESRLKFRLLDYLGTYVSCFSEDSTSTLMWSHYADSHKGMCIEYDFNKILEDNILKYILFPVAYTDNPFDLELLIDDFDHEIYKYSIDVAVLCASLNKAKVWNYEKEWRIVFVNTTDNNRRYWQMPFIRPSRVYLGYHFLKGFFVYKDSTEQEDNRARNKIINFIKVMNYLKNNNIKLSIMKPNIGSFRLSSVDISVDYMIGFIKNHFKGEKPNNICFYYTVHDRLMEDLSKIEA